MKKYQDNKINEGTAEQDLLDNLFNFYIRRFSSSSVEDTETHFLKALSGLVDSGELPRETVQAFLDDKGIEGEIPKPEQIRKSNSYNSYSSGGCGYSAPRSTC